MTTLFISDLHLDAKRPAVTQAFLQLLQEQAASIDALYILGDFFEIWIGDDERSELIEEVTAALKKFTATSTPLYLMHGNRDFFIGDSFCQQTGCQLIADPTVIDLYGKPVLLLHGDSLCIDDHEYMAFRQQSRNPAWQQQMLALPLEQRRQIAAQARAQSTDANSNKAEDIMDVNGQEVIKVLEAHHCATMIHGHTHRPAIHQLTLSSETGLRIVLGDWEQTAWQLIYAPDHQYDLQEFAIN
ncbi:MAG: UDP-2,3-diacylglucosamine hydrolase [Oceanicoccus sp.]|jgi:UDP-2,3-diacylglucosamine hydrolase